MLSWLELPLILAMLALFAAGLAMLLSALFVYFRDFQPIWEVLLQVLFYASPVIIPLDHVQAKLSPTLFHIYMLNPLATVLQQFRHAMINPRCARAPLSPWGAASICSGRSRSCLACSCSGSWYSTAPRRTWPRICKALTSVLLYRENRAHAGAILAVSAQREGLEVAWRKGGSRQGRVV